MNHPTNSDASPTLPGTKALALLQNISTWGNTTTIIIHGGCVFEFKGHFPKGELAEGFYNLKGEKNSEGHSGFEGHLKLDNVHSIQLQSKNHRGRESHAFVFCDSHGEAIFKIFLGRDSQGELLPDQLTQFKAIQSSLTIQ